MARSVARKAGDHALGRKRVGELYFGGAHGIDGKIGVEIADSFADDGHELRGISGGAQINGHIVDIVAAQVGNESLLGDFVAQIGVFDVLDDTDDFHWRGCTRVAAETHMQTEWISTGEIFAGERFVDDNRGGTPVIVLFC
jgi:hypothetical protein